MNFVRWLFEHSASSNSTFLAGHGLEEATYAEVWSRIRALAHRLARDGRGRRYLIVAPNGEKFVVGYLATMLSGNVPVPLEARVPARDLRDVVERAEPAGAFVEGERRAELESVAGLTILDEAHALPADSCTHEELPETDDGELAAIVFTSGSTGPRKGVMLSHGNLRANTAAIVDYFGLTSADRMLVTLPFSYTYGASLLHTHVRVGGSLILGHGISPGTIPSEIERYRCTGLAGVPSTYQFLINRTEFLAREYPTLRYLSQSGGKLADAYRERLVRAFPDKRVFFMYGASEATTRLTYLAPELALERLGSIGKPLPGVKIEVRDPSGRPVGVGETGEIVASGPNVMLGYWRDEAATREVLRDGELYTGDLATVDEDGFLYIVGRAKRIIKSAGHRVSPAAIEAVIQELATIDDCRVVGTPDETMGEAIVAVVQTRGEPGAVRDAVLDCCRRQFPSYMCPQRVEFMERMPMTASQKVDLARLAEWVAGTA